MNFWNPFFNWLVGEDPKGALEKKILIRPHQQYKHEKVTVKVQPEKKAPEPYQDVLYCVADALTGTKLSDRITIRRLSRMYNCYCGKYGLRKRRSQDLRSLLSKRAGEFKKFGFARKFASEKIAYYFSSK